MTKYITEELELDPETLTKLTEIAEEHNATIDNVVNEILISYIAEKITIEDYAKLLSPSKVKETLGKYYIIIDDEGKSIARVTPIG